LESGHYRVDALVVVDVDEDEAVRRVTAQRGLTEKQVRARMDAQISREQRRAAADLVIDNTGSLESLRQQSERAWGWIAEQRAAVVDS
jgi:dephospho-CoA kinase